jgi:Radical SAM superfamily/Iron-sulfur cluster-binding domain
MGALSPIKDVALRIRDCLRLPVDRFLAGWRLHHGRRAWIHYLNFDLATSCNLRCIYCSLDHDRPANLMSLGLFERVLDEIADRKRTVVNRIQLHHGADALVHPRFPEFLEAIARRKDRPGFPEIRLLTNAALLRGARADALFDTAAVDYVRFSLDGGTREDFERLRPPAKWDRVLGNVEKFMDENERRGSPMRTGIITIFDRPPGELDPRFTALTRRVGHYMPRPPHNWEGSADVGVARGENRPTGLCQFVLFHLVVLHDGRVVPCCADLNGRGPIGDLGEQTLYEIVKGEARVRMVRLMKQGRRAEIDLCRRCDLE